MSTTQKMTTTAATVTNSDSRIGARCRLLVAASFGVAVLVLGPVSAFGAATSPASQAPTGQPSPSETGPDTLGIKSPVIVAVISISGTLLTILVSALVNDGLGKRRERAKRRNSTYEEVKRLGAEYSLLLSRNEAPSAEFLARLIIVNREVSDRFSENAFQTFRKMERFFAAGAGELPQGMTHTAYTEARETALDALRAEL